MNQVIIPDLNATETLDIGGLQLEMVEMAAETQLSDLDASASKEDKEKAKAVAIECQDAVEAYKPAEGSPSIDIGYVPTSMMTKLINRGQRLFKKRESLKKELNREPEQEDIPEEVSEARDDLAREWLKWGVKAHTNLAGWPFVCDDVEYKGRMITVITPLAIEMYERMGLLYALESKIMGFNTLSKKKKTS